MDKFSNAQIELLRMLEGKKVVDYKTELLGAMQQIAHEYEDQDFAIDVAQSIGFDKLNWMNFQVAVDAQHSFNFAVEPNAEYILTREGMETLHAFSSNI